MTEPIYEKTVALPLGYTFTARARPSSVRRTVVRLAPWALFVMLPAGKRSRIALAAARRVSPLFKQNIRA